VKAGMFMKNKSNENQTKTLSYLSYIIDQVKNSFLPVLQECPWNVKQKQLHEVLGKQHQTPMRNSKDSSQMVSILPSLP